METVLIVDSLVCRSCLAASGEMKNMLDWGLDDDFFNFTNIRITKNDGVSDLLCIQCEEILLKFKSFRNQCQQSDVLLKSTKKPQISTDSDFPIAYENTATSCLHDSKLDIAVTAPNMDEKIYLPCPYTCKEKFIKKKDLLIHLTKTHKTHKNFEVNVQYYCTITDCHYHVDQKNKNFTERKYLNQHYNKVHGNKIYFCETCTQSFVTIAEFNRHFKDCNVSFSCEVCDASYKNKERLMVHLLRKHPKEHKEYKDSKKRKSETVVDVKRTKTDFDYNCDSPKRSLATQTSDIIKNDVTLPLWNETKTDEISTQTVFEDLLSLKSQTSEDDTMFFPETVLLSDIQTQTFPPQFGLRSNKETITNETQSPDLSMKETQTCVCLYDSNRFDVTSSPSIPSSVMMSTETQTFEVRSSVKSDVMLSFSSAETQTCFDEGNSNDL